jgi:hypothetical protein
MPEQQPVVHDTPAQDTLPQDSAVRDIPAPDSAAQDIPAPDSAAQDAAQDTAVAARPAPTYEPVEQDDGWLQESPELPTRPRRRLLTPLPLALLGVLLLACGFIGGVLVEKGQTSPSPAAGGAASLASRFAALRGGASSRGARVASPGGAFGGAALGSSGGGRAVAGQVAFLAGTTLYLTNSEGNTVKVTSSPATSVTKSVKTNVKDIHPGETVTATGSAGSSGALTAESIRVGASGGALAGLFGGSGGSGRAGRGAAGGEPALFGSGG